MSMEQREFRIGYNLLWRLTFFLFAICMLLASILLLVQSLLGTSEGLLVPSSMLVAAILMSFYLIPFISTRQQMLVVTTGGLQLVDSGASYHSIFDDYEPPNYFAAKQATLFSDIIAQANTRPSGLLRMLGRL